MKEFLKKITPEFLVDSYHFFLSFLAASFYRFPSRKLKVIGVTGTNGKSTVVEMIVRILEEAGFKVASTSSIKFKIAGREWENKLKMTMPGRFFVQKFLREAVNRRCQYAILEVTSEGIKQHRHQFIDFQTAIFTNLTPEHIEAHGGFENYRRTKGELFKETKNAHIINLDDENANFFLQFLAKEIYGYTLSREKTLEYRELKIIKAEKKEVSSQGTNFSVNDTDFHLKLLGEFNIYNALAAISFGLSQGINLDIIKNALEKIETIPGRMEEVISQSFKVFVDYAFTPNSLKKVYSTIRNNFHPNKTICVLGAAGGGRDKWKRPILGQIAVKNCDEVIITNEDPYDEDPMEIIKQIAEGTGRKGRKILDRREAIREALKLAKDNDVIVITGKGCEPWICLSHDKKIPWDDRKVVKEEFQKIYGKI